MRNIDVMRDSGAFALMGGALGFVFFALGLAVDDPRWFFAAYTSHVILTLPNTIKRGQERLQREAGRESKS